MIISIKGKVVSGKRIGTKLGFPTANIAPEGSYELPKNGVYAARIILPGGASMKCVLNQGDHPTLPEGGATIEAFIMDFSGDLYGSEVTVEYEVFLRDEKRFPDIEALKAQIASDVARARAIL